MEKVLCVAFEHPGAGPPDDAASAALVERLHRSDHRWSGLALQVQDGAATETWRGGMPSPAPGVVAAVAAWSDCADDIGELDALLAPLSPARAGYRVAEAVPRRWDAPPTEPSEPQPGVTLTSLLFRAPGTTPDEFLAHWYERHMPMSLLVHPQRGYVRNVVAEVLTKGAPRPDAICEELFAEVDDVLDPTRFFGAEGADRWRERRRDIGRDIGRFLDASLTTASIMRSYAVRAQPC